MSGPKKADVVAQLNIARGSQRQCANLISSAEDAAIKGVLRDVDGILRDASGLDERLRGEIGTFDAEMRRIAPDTLRNACDAAGKGSEALNAVRDGLIRVQGEVNRVQQEEATASQTFENAEREFQRAEAALRRAGDHYLANEMRWAQDASRLYEQAARELSAAAQTRKNTQQTATAALRQARDAQSTLNSALHQVQSTREEARSLLRAEAEAKRITEEKRRLATITVEKARSALGRMDGSQHQKFCPGVLDGLRRELDTASRDIGSGRFDEASGAGVRIASAADKLEKEVVEAQRKFDLRKGEAETQIGILEATLVGLDESLIQEWSSQPTACGFARGVVERSRLSVTEERFEDATDTVKSTRQKLAEALQSAAEAKSSHERRAHIGDAIMEVLQELNFDVSFNAGNRDEPLSISGQTPDVAGKGDFNIAIPLSGEVGFEVNSPEGDISCISAVKELQKRLAERGVKWETTDWGHAEGAAPRAQQSQVKQQETVTAKSKH